MAVSKAVNALQRLGLGLVQRYPQYPDSFEYSHCVGHVLPARSVAVTDWHTLQKTMTHLRSSSACAVTIMSSIRSVQTKPSSMYPASLCEQVSFAMIGPATVDEMIRMNVSTSTCNVEVRAAPQPILHADAVSHAGAVSFTMWRVGLSIPQVGRGRAATRLKQPFGQAASARAGHKHASGLLRAGGGGLKRTTGGR